MMQEQNNQQNTIYIAVAGVAQVAPRGKNNKDVALPGAYSYTVVCDGKIISKDAGYKKAQGVTAYSMILTALEEAFKSGKVYHHYNVRVISNNSAIQNGVNGAYKVWQKKYWLGKNGPVKSADIWKRIVPYFTDYTSVEAVAPDDQHEWLWDRTVSAAKNTFQIAKSDK